MSAANKRIGAQFELDTLKHLRTHGYDTERLRLAGRDDEGDLVMKAGGLVFIFELKNEKTINLTSYVRQAELEAQNYAKHRGLTEVPYWAAVVKKRNSSIAESFVVTSLTEFLRRIEVPF